MGATRRGKRSQAAKLSRQAEAHRKAIDAALQHVVAEAERDRLHALRQDANRALKGVGVVSRGMAAPVRASVTRHVAGQWQAMPSDVPVSLSDARAAEYRRNRDRERDSTRASNDLLARDRAAQDVQRIADAMRDN